jgi:hypothetical protein
VTVREVPQEGPQGELVVRGCGSLEALGRSWLADDETGSAFGDPEALLEG